MRINILILITFILLFMGCSIPDLLEYDGEEKYCIKGGVYNEAGDALPNISIILRGTTSEDCSFIQRGVSDFQGAYNFCFSKLLNNEMWLEFNNAINWENSCNYLYRNNDSEPNPNYSWKRISLNNLNFKEYEFVVDQEMGTLYEPVNITLTFKSNSTTSSSSYFSFNHSTDVLINSMAVSHGIIYQDNQEERWTVAKNSYLTYTSNFVTYDTIFIGETDLSYEITF